jgi:hypothetical protein
MKSEAQGDYATSRTSSEPDFGSEDVAIALCTTCGQFSLRQQEAGRAAQANEMRKALGWAEYLRSHANRSLFVRRHFD